MLINSDFSQRVVIRPDAVAWRPSPMAGVERKMLDRIGGEVARATSLVRYAPRSRFSSHRHGGGEEFLVLDGVFSDEGGDYPVGSYVRNPIGSAHAPHSDQGCTIFVKLHQFDPGDTARLAIDTRRTPFLPGGAPGLSVLPLHRFGAERVALMRWAPGTRGDDQAQPGGEEILVIEGGLQDEYGDYPAGSWIRNPPLFRHARFSDGGCLIYVKTGHLADLCRSAP